MKPKALMLLGAASGVASLAIVIVASKGFDLASVAIIVFASGAIFGEGYGIWEERNRETSHALQAKEG